MKRTHEVHRPQSKVVAESARDREIEPLFRQEVLDAGAAQWLGHIRLAQPVGAWPIVAAAAVMATLMLALIILGDYARKTDIPGIVEPVNGSLNVPRNHHRRRILLARALYQRPQVLVLGEATSHVDILNENKVSSALRKLAITRILVAHRPETINSAQRIIHLQGGSVSGKGCTLYDSAWQTKLDN
jgi:hypothetical protein